MMKQLFFLAIILGSVLYSCKTNHTENKEQPAVVQDTASDTLNLHADRQAAGADVWQIDTTNSRITFAIKNFGSVVNGSFSGLRGLIYFDPDKPESGHIEAAINVKTIRTGIDKRDKDLQEDKFFNSTRYPEIIFRSDKISRSDSGYHISGSLFIKGKTISRDVPFTFTQNGKNGVFKSHFTVQRLDYDIGGTGPVMGKEVKVSVEIAVTKTKS